MGIVDGVNQRVSREVFACAHWSRRATTGLPDSFHLRNDYGAVLFTGTSTSEEHAMDDDRVWSFEKSLWDGGPDRYRELVDAECLMVLPHPPFVFSGSQAIEAVADTPRWTAVEFSKGQIARPQEGLIVIAYHVDAARDDKRYEADCTSTYRRLSHDQWRVVPHQQTPPQSRAGTVEKVGG